MHEIYLDNSSTTMVDESVARIALEMMTTEYGNPSSAHNIGLRAQLKLDAAREQVAGALNAPPETIYFTSGGTESNNLAILGAVSAKKRRGNRIVVTAYEHASVLEPLKWLERQGFDVVRVPPMNDGNIDGASIVRAVDDKTILVSVMMINNELGSILPVWETAALIKKAQPGCLFHTDAVQALGKVAINLSKSDVDLMSVSGHKVHAPKGIGALYVKKGTHIKPVMHGGGQENKLRPGTENTAQACAFGAAARISAIELEKNLAKTKLLRNRLAQRLRELPGFFINSPPDATPYIMSISVCGVRAEPLLRVLQDEGIYVSAGAACARGAKSHVLKAIGLPDERIDGALRISFSKYNEEIDIDALVKALKEGVSRLSGRRSGNWT